MTRPATRLVPLLSPAIALAGLSTLVLAARSDGPGEPRRPSPPHAQTPTGDAKPLPQVDAPATEPSVRFDRDPSQVGVPHAAAKPPEQPRAAAARRDPTQVIYAEGSDGNLWVRGATYKAAFGPEGATYIPFLGSRAPQNYPLDLDLAHVSVGGEPLAFAPAGPATRAAETVVLDRGTLSEVYAIGASSIEQKFVFDSLPAQGELVVRVSVASELALAEQEDAFEFRNDLGGVRYGRATALDAAGASVPAPTTWTGSGFEIRVPAEFVASARFPLTIDPIVSSFAVDATTEDDFLPDVSYDVTTNRWLTVYEEIFSATDHDVVWSLLTSTGALVTTGFVDGSLSAYWAAPAVANSDNANQFLVVAAVGLPTSGARVIRGRTFNASTSALGTDVLISVADQSGDKHSPDVGGDPFGGTSSYYGVVWTRVFVAGSDDDVHARCVDQTGALVGTGTILIDNSGSSLDRNPAIAKGTNLVEWGVVWQRQTTATNREIRGAILGWSGTINSASFSIDASTSDDSNPDVSTQSDAGQYVVVYQRDFTTDEDIYARLMSGTTTLDTIGLTGLEDSLGADNLFEDQLRPTTDSDGKVFVVAYAESFNGSATDYDPRISTLSVISNQLRLGENHLSFPVGFSTTREDFPSVSAAEASDGAERRCFLVWQDAAGGTALTNIEGGLYDAGQYTSFCHPGLDGVMSCPCSNPPGETGRGCANGATGGAILACTGTASIASDSMLLTSSGELATALSIFTQGDGLTVVSGVVFGQGVRCVGGSLKRLYTKTAVAGTASAPTGADPDVSARSAALGDVIPAGSTRYYYVYYRQPTVLGGCPSSATFNTTQSIATCWAP